MRELTIRHVMQPSMFFNTHACMAMITGKDVGYFIERFTGQPLNLSDIFTVLIENKIFPIETPDRFSLFPYKGFYLVFVPSLNAVAVSYPIIVEIGADVESSDDIVIYDPLMGFTDRQYYKNDSLHKSSVYYNATKVIYLDTEILSNMLDVVG